METMINSHSNKRGCKIRKRGCSSSSSSSIVRKYRIKRPILSRKRAGGSTTPVKTIYRKSPVSVASPARISPQDHHNDSVSARKLAATLWEINGIPSNDCLRNKKEMRNREKTERCMQDLHSNVSDPRFSPFSEKTAKSRGDRISKTSVISHKLQVIDYNPDGSDVPEMKTHSSGHRVGIISRLEDVRNSLKTSKELVELLIHPEDNHTTGTPLISALKFELASARSEIKHLIKDHLSNNNEIECLIKCFAKEKSAWKQRERERILGVTAKLSREIEAERKLRKRTERLNKKLAKELDEAKNLLSRVAKEMDSEKRAKEILEQVCDELARGIGDNKAEVEKLRRENERVKEEIEKEREMMQLADVLREQRVQMKLSEAKYQFEESNAVVEKLKNELEYYLSCKNVRDDEEIRSPGLELNMDSNMEREDDSDEEDDLRSIELNMDSNNKSFKWSFVSGEEFSETKAKTRWEEEVETEREKSIKNLRDYILSSVKIPSG